MVIFLYLNFCSYIFEELCCKYVTFYSSPQPLVFLIFIFNVPLSNTIICQDQRHTTADIILFNQLGGKELLCYLSIYTVTLLYVL